MTLSAPSFVSFGPPTGLITGITPNWPNGHQAYDTGILLLESSNETVTLPSGWSEFTSSPQGTGVGGVDADATRLTGYWKIANSSSEPAVTIADVGDHVLGQILVFRGCDPVTPVDVTSGDVLATATSLGTGPAVSTSTDNCLVVFGISQGIDNSVTRFNAWSPNAGLSSFTGLTNIAVANGNGGGFTVAAGVLAAAGASSVATVTLVQNSRQARITVALRPGTIPSTSSNALFHPMALTSDMIHPIMMTPVSLF